MQYGKNISFVMAGLIFQTIFATGIHAKPLPQEECEALRKQKVEMVGKGLEKIVGKGAKWASDNLNREQLDEIGSYIKVGETIRFRCHKSASAQKRKSGSYKKVPLPKRNPRRVQKKKASKSNTNLLVGSATKGTNETNTVISAITKASVSTPKGAGQSMRKTFAE